MDIVECLQYFGRKSDGETGVDSVGQGLEFILEIIGDECWTNTRSHIVNDESGIISKMISAVFEHFLSVFQSRVYACCEWNG